MKELTKDQLIDLVYNNCAKVIGLNSNEVKEYILNYIKESGDNWHEMLVKFVTAYGNEIRRECCETFAESLYEIFYAE